MSAVTDTISIALGAAPATDAFGLELAIDGHGALETLVATGPGLFRTARLTAEGWALGGWIVGFLQRGPLLTPVAMPCDGWVLATVPDASRVGHGTPIVRILPASESILP